MITEEEFLNKVSELMDKEKGNAIIKARSLFRSGAIDTEQYDNDYILPKMFVSAYGAHMKYRWLPLSAGKKMLKEIKNFEHFI